MQSYQKLIAWQKADLLAKEVYKITTKFPKDEIYGLTSQLRRAILSVPLNIIEGYARNNRKEFKNFLRIAYASLIETEYLELKDYQNILEFRKECGAVLWRLLQSQGRQNTSTQVQ